MKKLRILIVEDENIVARDIESSLKNMGHNNPVIVNTGPKAIDQLEQANFDLVLMDIMLKGEMNGIEVANIIHERFPIPVVFLTAYGDEKTLESAKNSEPYGYLMKPFKEKDLQVTIEIAMYKFEKDFEIKRDRDHYQSIVENKETKDSIFIRANFRLNRVKFDDLYYVEAFKDYVTVHTGDNVFTTHATMKEMMRMLPAKDFVRIHRSYIVRLDKIFSIKYPDLVIEGKMKVLPIGGLFRKELYGRLNQI